MKHKAEQLTTKKAQRVVLERFHDLAMVGIDQFKSASKGFQLVEKLRKEISTNSNETEFLYAKMSTEYKYAEGAAKMLAKIHEYAEEGLTLLDDGNSGVEEILLVIEGLALAAQSSNMLNEEQVLWDSIFEPDMDKVHEMMKPIVEEYRKKEKSNDSETLKKVMSFFEDEFEDEDDDDNGIKATERSIEIDTRKIQNKKDFAEKLAKTIADGIMKSEKSFKKSKK